MLCLLKFSINFKSCNCRTFYLQQPKRHKDTIPGIIASFLVLFALFCYTGGLIAWNVARKVSYEYVRSQRNEVKFRDTIVVSAETIKGNGELTWVKHDEIRYHGQMYDIKTQTTLADGRIMLVGHFDNWDNKLFKELERMLEPSPGSKPLQKEKGTFYWLADAIIPLQQRQQYSSYPNFSLMHFPKDDQAFLTKYRPDVPVPPPNA